MSIEPVWEKRQNLVEEKRVNLGEEVPLATPLMIYMDVCNICNFRCKFCAPHSGEKVPYKRQIMTWELYEKIINDICVSFGTLKVLRFVGMGEPLINKSLPQMVAYAKREKAAERIEIVTNGILLTREMSDELIESGLDRVRLSIEAMDAEGYKKMCGAKIEWDKFISNLAYFYEHRGTCEVYAKIVDVAVETEEEKSLFYEEFGRIADKVYIESVTPVWADYNKICDDFNISEMGLYGQKKKRVKICPFPFYSFLIHPDGEVTACCSDWKRGIVLGNVSNECIKEIWGGQKYKGFLREMIDKGRAVNHICAMCDYPDFNVIDELDGYRHELLKRFQIKKQNI